MILKGKIKKLGNSFGVIHSPEYNEDLQFKKSELDTRLNIGVGQSVYFRIRPENNGRSSAYDIKIALSTFKSAARPPIPEEKGKSDNKEPVKFETKMKKFTEFICSGFFILDDENQEINNILKLVVRDNKITDIEKEFLMEKTAELKLNKSLVEKAESYLFSNNPYFDSILKLIFSDDVVTSKEIAFLLEKAKENNFSPSFTNNRFWQYLFKHEHLNSFDEESLKDLINIWYLCTQDLKIVLEQDWFLLRLNIHQQLAFEKIVKIGITELISVMIKEIDKLPSIDNNELNKIKKKYVEPITLEENYCNERCYELLEKSLRHGISSYSKLELYSIFNVPQAQRGGKWNNGYCKHENEWFIFANIGVTGEGMNNEVFDYNNYFDDLGNLNWEAINASKLDWPSIKEIIDSEPFIFIRTPKTIQNKWEYIGKGQCIKVRDTTPVGLVWKILKPEFNGDDLLNIQPKLTHKKIDINSKPTQLKFSGIDKTTEVIFREKFKDNPFTAYFDFKNYAKSILKIKAEHKIKSIWNDLMDLSD